MKSTVPSTGDTSRPDAARARAEHARPRRLIAGGAPSILMPDSASAAGEAYELVSSRYLCDFSGLRHIATPFYTRTKGMRWAQFDGLFARGDGAQLVLEAKFYNHAVGLSTPGIASRPILAAQAGASGIVISSRSGFSRDILRARFSIEKVLLSWSGMRRRLQRWGRGLWTAALDPIVQNGDSLLAASGARLYGCSWRGAEAPRDGFIILPTETERWARRLPASPCDITIGRPVRRMPNCPVIDLVSAWTVEDSLRGFSPSRPALLEEVCDMLAEGPVDHVSAWKAMWRRGYRGRKGGIKNALDNLVVIGAAEKFRSRMGLLYGTLTDVLKGRAGDYLAETIARWPAFVYYKVAGEEGPREKHSLATKLSSGFIRFYPYARSLYNPAKVAGLMALDRYYSPSISTQSVSYASCTRSGSREVTGSCLR